MVLLEVRFRYRFLQRVYSTCQELLIARFWCLPFCRTIFNFDIFTTLEDENPGHQGALLRSSMHSYRPQGGSLIMFFHTTFCGGRNNLSTHPVALYIGSWGVYSDNYYLTLVLGIPYVWGDSFASSQRKWGIIRNDALCAGIST